jgi:glycosyltransferase involved in cell wall biosynthesis
LFFYTDAHQHGFGARFVWHIVDIFHLRSRNKIRDILYQEKPDVVHTHNLMGLGFLIPRLIKKLGLLHIHTVHDVQLVEPSGIILKQKEKSFRYTGFPTRLYTWIMKSLFASPSVVISPSQFLLQFYEARGFFQNSVRIVMQNPITLLPRLQKNTQHEVFSFLYVGQIEEHKGVKFLIETFLQYLEKQNHCELHVVGAGSSLLSLQKVAEHEKRIIFHGKVERKRLPEFFASSDITIVPSLCYENSPTVIFESASFGVPVLASNIEGVAELIQEGKNGITFVVEDAISLQEKLLWCTTHIDDIAKMGEYSKESISNFSKENYIEKLLGIYTGEQK